MKKSKLKIAFFSDNLVFILQIYRKKILVSKDAEEVEISKPAYL
ncbi:hypothetical protein [Flavisolibacter ginsenosidimutans]|nr:hypothetical protein [Flavisolibacter ginsenosidimutans]